MKKLLTFIILVTLAFTSTSQLSVFQSRGIGGGGSMFFPAINPANDNDFFVACDMSELFHSIDGGLNYSQLPFTSLQCFNNSTYGYTNNPLIAYSNFNDGNSGYPVKTTDGGLTWQQMNAYNVGTYGGVTKMENNYGNSQQLLIGAYGDILFSSDGGTTFSLVHHTANMGAGLILGGVWWDAPHIYIGTNEGLFHSTDNGLSFSVMTTTGITAGDLIWSFAAAKTGNTTRFVCITAATADVYNGVMPWDYSSFAKGVYTMDNTNGAWVSHLSAFNFSSDFLMYATMAKNNINVIYLGGHDNSLGAPLVYKSADGGNTFSKVFSTTNNANISTAWEGSGGDKQWSWSETCFGITAAPNNSNKVLFGNYSNVQASDDGGTTWRQAYVNVADEHPAGSSTPQHRAYHSIGMENTTCWQVFWYDQDTMISGYSDIGCIRSKDAGNSWGFQYTGFSVNSLYRIAKGANGTLYGGCSNIHDMYQSTRLADAQLDANDGNGKIVYSTNGGFTWANLHVFNHPVFWLAIDQNTPNRMYASVINYAAGAGQGGIWVSNDINNLAASSWVKLSNPPRTEGHPASIVVLNDGKVVCTYSGRRNSSGTFTASSGVFIYDPSNTTWTDVSAAGMNYWTKDIVLDPTDATQNTWYACVFSGWGGAPNGLGGLYKTTNRGQNWVKLTGAQFDRVTSITFDPNDANRVLLTTETQGLWMTNDISLASPTFQLLTSYPFRQPERVYFNPYNPDEVWVSSFGNGMKVASMGIINQLTTDEINSTVHVYPNPFQNEFTVDVKKAGEIKIYDVVGKLIATIFASVGPLKIDTHEWQSGVYLISTDKETAKIVKQ